MPYCTRSTNVYTIIIYTADKKYLKCKQVKEDSPYASAC